jgi:hypothetical protein
MHYGGAFFLPEFIRVLQNRFCTESEFRYIGTNYGPEAEFSRPCQRSISEKVIHRCKLLCSKARLSLPSRCYGACNHAGYRYYGLVWRLGSLNIKAGESREVVRLTHHIIDADKTKVLNDKKAEPVSIDPQAWVKLVVPAPEQVAQLSQSGTPQVGRSYWMALSNRGSLVKRGDRVIMVIE